MVGVAGRSGGARPGAGRPSDPTREYQATMRSRFEACVTVEDWDAAIAALLRDAKAGNVAAFRELAPWVVGRVPEETKLSGDLALSQRPDLTKLSDQELEALARLVRKASHSDAGAAPA